MEKQRTLVEKVGGKYKRLLRTLDKQCFYQIHQQYQKETNEDLHLHNKIEESHQKIYLIQSSRKQRFIFLLEEGSLHTHPEIKIGITNTVK